MVGSGERDGPAVPVVMRSSRFRHEDPVLRYPKRVF